MTTAIPSTLANLSGSLEEYRVELQFDLANSNPAGYYVSIDVNFDFEEYEIPLTESSLEDFVARFTAAGGDEPDECFIDDSRVIAFLTCPWEGRKPILDIVEGMFPGLWSAMVRDRETRREAYV